MRRARDDADQESEHRAARDRHRRLAAIPARVGNSSRSFGARDVAVHLAARRRRAIRRGRTARPRPARCRCRRRARGCRTNSGSGRSSRRCRSCRAAARAPPSAACGSATSSTCRRGRSGRAPAARYIPAGRSAARKSASGGATSVSTMTPKVPAMNEPTAAMQSAAPARPFLRHGVAVDAGHHRGGFARDAQQDRGGRAAILRAVIDAGEHHDRLGGVEPEGQRQQDGDAGERADARQHADQRADQAAEERDTTARPAAARPRSRAAGCRGRFPRVRTRARRVRAAPSAPCRTASRRTA